jgi:ribosomal-protein-alanine acetyltransferase
MFSVIKIASLTLTERYNPSIFNYFYETFHKGFIVAEKDHKIIGFIVGVKVNENLAKILMLSVSEQYRKQNIGFSLLKRFIEEISQEDIKNIELEVRTGNKKAIKFYKNNGFVIKEKLYKFYQDESNAYTMEKQL